MRRPSRRLLRRGLIAVALLALLFVLVFRGVDEIDLHSAPFYAESLANADRALAAAKAPAGEAPLEAGAARVEIAPPAEWRVPLGGNRRVGMLKAAGKRPESVYVRSIAIRQGERRLILSSIDVLVIHRALSERVLERIREHIPLASDEFFPVATHTHNGPGGYWSGFLPQQVLGPYHEEVFDYLAEQIARSAVRAWEELRPARLLVDSVAAGGPVANSIRVGDLENPQLVLVRFEGTSEPFTIDLLNYSAHPTSGLDGDRRLSGDYPGVLSSMLEGERHIVAFTPGTIGDQRPKFLFDDASRPRVENQAQLLHDKGWLRLAPEATAPWPPLESFEFDVRLPPIQARLLRLGPLGAWRVRDGLAGRLLPDHFDTARIQIARIGPVLILGAPCDLATSVGLPILDEAKRRGFFPFFTSMAEDWIGYVLTEQEYRTAPHKTREQMHGAVAGPLFREIYLRVLAHLGGQALPEQPAAQ